MILKNLTLKNFRKFRDVTIDFPDGITGVVGLNGVGKSTIFEALSWILFGTIAARTSADEIKRVGTVSSDRCRGELEFIFEDSNYRIVREMHGKSSSITATASVNGKIAATSADTVSKFIQKKLGMDFKSFFTSIFAKQKELNALSTMVASERRPLILRMLGIDSLDDVIKEIKSDKKEKQSIIDRLGQDLTDEKGKDKIDIYKIEIKQLEKQRDDHDKLIKEIKKRIDVFSDEIKNLEKKLENSKSDYEKIKEKNEKLIQKKTLFEEKEKIVSEIKSIKDKIKERKDNIEHLKKKSHTFSKIESDQKTSGERLKTIVKKIEDLVKKNEQKKTLVSRLNEDIKTLKEKNNKIKEIGPDARCPTCERVLAGQFKKLLTNFDNEISKKDKQISSFLKEIETLDDEKQITLREQAALEKKISYLNTQLREKERIDTTINNISDELKSEKQDLEKKQKRANELKTVDFDLKEYKKISSQVNEFYKTYQDVLIVLDKNKDEFNNLKIDFERKQSSKKLVEQKIVNFKQLISTLKDYKKKIKEEKVLVQHLGMLSELMSNFRTHLISRIRPTLASYSSDFFNRLTDGKYRELELDENYNLLVFDNENAYSIDRFSGGEEDLANLCLRLAISEVITERAGGAFNFIILDEIFGSQDVYRRQNIMNALGSLSSKFRQIFLITHVDDVKNYMENIIYVTEDENSISSVKIK